MVSDTIRLDTVPLCEWEMFGESGPGIIAGPCSAESEEQVMETARSLKELGINVFRAGIWKPRTHPGSFEGIGVPGLKWMQRVKNELGMTVSTEVAGGRHVFECLEHGIDMVWIGARTTANPFLVQEIADALQGTSIPVFVKNPVSPDIGLWIGALERLNRAGINRLGVIHRGFSTVDKMKYRNSPGWQIAVEFRSRYPYLPFFCDPSHMAGSREYVMEVAQRALDLGLDGLMVESHCNPSCALSDAGQQLEPWQLGKMLAEGLVVRLSDSDSPKWRRNIDRLRTEIDIIDENILYMLSSRMKVSRQIGEYKRDSNVSILQTSRWDEVLDRVKAKGKEYGLDEDLLIAVFNAIHEASVRVQDDVMSGRKP